MRHLIWVPATAAVGFTAAFVFADLLQLPVDLYYLLYFLSVGAFAAYYTRRTHLDAGTWVRRRAGRSIALGVLAGLVLMQGVLARPQTAPLDGFLFWWALLWRGLAYGFVDGVLLIALPWIIAWRAFDAEGRGFPSKLAASAAAWVAVLVVTTAYHLGYADFRSSKIVQPNIGSSIASLATLASANPVASPIAHVCLHVAAVVHTPHTDLFLPPHREP